MRPRWTRLVWIAPVAFVAMALFVVAGGEIVKLLWNWILPPMFGWPELSFWKALGLLALCRILFGGFSLRGGRSWGSRRRMEERWNFMTPEEREVFRSRMRRRWGLDPAGAGPEA